MKIFGFFVDQSKRLMALVIVLVLLTSTVGVVSAGEPEENKELLDCLCRCLEPPGGLFSCSYDTEDRGWSPSCRDLSNGPCICKASGCFRGPLPTEGECYDNCYAQYAQEKPEDEEGEENHPPTVRLTYYPKYPVEHPVGHDNTIHFTANAYDKDGDELKYEWYVDGVKQKDCTRAIVEGSMRAGSHTCKVIVSDGKGGTTMDSVSFTVAEYDLYLEVVADEVTLNGRQVVKGVKHPLFERDEIKTSYWLDPGCAILRYADGTQVKVMPESHFVIFHNKLFLYKGGVWIEARKEGHEFIVNAPYLVVGTKGTEFEVLAEDDGTTTCNVFEGMVDVSDINMTKTVSVNAGETTISEPHGVPSDPEPFDQRSIDRWWENFPFDTIPSTTDVTSLTFESHSKPCGSSVQIPLTLNGIDESIGNMDITLSYDPSVLEATAVTKGDLTIDSLFEYNIMAGTILISLADADGFSGNGTIAYVKFDVTGAADSTSPLQIVALTANRAEDYEALTIPTNDGVFRVIIISTEESGGFTVSVSDTTGAKGSTVEVPINLEGATEVGSMDIVLNYDADVLCAVDVEAGELGKNALIESNTARDGEVIIALADSSGINGDGTVASVAFEVIGDAGTTSYLTLEAVSVHNLDLGEIIPTTECGTFLVGVQKPWFDEHPESIIGELETFDFDNDGSEDRIVYTFEPEEVAEDLFLVRSIEFNKTDSELFEGKIVLKFENKGDTPIEYSHIEEIPKSFAESVDDLVFSIPPDEIIDPDPKVMWRKSIGVLVTRFVLASYVSDNPFGAVKAYHFILDYAVAECNKQLSGKSRDYCLLVLAEELKVAEPTEVCHEIESEDCKNLCLGRVTGDKNYCDKIKNEDLKKLCLGEIVCPACTGSGLKFNTSIGGGMIRMFSFNGRLLVGSKTIDGDYKNCIYDGDTITWSDSAEKLVDQGFICICESNSAKEEFQRLYSNSVNLPQGMTRAEGLMGVKDAYILSDIPGKELSLVVIDDTSAPEIIATRIIGWYLYRERYLMGVAVSINDQEGHKFKRYDAISSFKELVKCAKEVVDKREGIN